MTEPIWITVKGRPIPKPRMTRRDRFIHRPIVESYRHFANNVREAYLKQRLEIGKFDTDRTVRLGFRFRFAGKPVSDIDNIIKGIKDALKGYALSDDNVRVVPGYFEVEVNLIDCGECWKAYGKRGLRLKKPKCVVRECDRQCTMIGFEEVENGI